MVIIEKIAIIESVLGINQLTQKEEKLKEKNKELKL